MDAAAALREAFGRAGRPATVALVGGFIAVGLATVVARQTLLSASLSAYAAADGAGALPIATERIRPVRLALPASYPAALAATLALAAAYEYLTVVALRVFAAGTELRAAATRRVGRAVLSGALVGVVARTAVAAGLIALVLPGVFLAAALLFAHARVAVDDDGPLAALRGSWGLTAGRRRSVASVLAALAALYLTPRLLAATVAGAPGLLLGGLLVGLAAVPSVALVAGTYAGLREADAGDDEQEADPYARPLGPEDLPEPD